MSVNQMEIPADEIKLSIGNRWLGGLCLIGAPMLLVQFIFNPGGVANPEPTFQGRIIAFLGVLYMGGWLAGAVGMRKLKVTGTGLGSYIVFIIQVIGLILATMFSVLDTFGLTYENGGLIFAVTDIAYPFSHLLMIVVGVLTWRAGVWPGLAKFAPLLVGVALPVTLSLMPLVGAEIGCFLFGSLTTVGLSIIGYTVIKSGKSREVWEV